MSVGLLGNLAGLNVLLFDPVNGFGFIYGGCNGRKTSYLFYISQDKLSVNTIYSVCISIENQYSANEQDLTRVKAFQDGKLWSDSTFKGVKATHCNFTLNTDFKIGQSIDNENMAHNHLGIITDVNIWSRALANVEMENITMSAKDAKKINRDDKIFDWTSFQHSGQDDKDHFNSFTIELEDLDFEARMEETLLITKALGYTEAMELCLSLGGFMPVAKDFEEHNQLMMNMQHPNLKIGTETCKSNKMWLPINQNIHDEVIVCLL